MRNGLIFHEHRFHVSILISSIYLASLVAITSFDFVSNRLFFSHSLCHQRFLQFPRFLLSPDPVANRIISQFLPVSASAMDEDEINYSVYKSIDIEFLGERRSILVKNDNGDCCLLAICNALSLRNDLTLEPKNNTEERELKSLLLEKLQSLYAQVLKERLSDAVLAVSNLDTYVPYPTSNSVDGFKKTEKDCKDIFQILGIPFYHGWIASSSVLESDMARIETRITETGLRRLVETIQDNEICVLYHNHDFYTATKYEGEVYMLVTDDVPGSDIRWVKPDGVFAKEDFSARSLSGSSDSDVEEDMNRENDAEDYVAAEGGGLEDAAAEGGLEDVAGQEYAEGGGLEYAEHLCRVSPTSVLDIPSSGSSDNE